MHTVGIWFAYTTFTTHSAAGNQLIITTDTFIFVVELKQSRAFCAYSIGYAFFFQYTK